MLNKEFIIIIIIIIIIITIDPVYPVFVLGTLGGTNGWNISLLGTDIQLCSMVMPVTFLTPMCI